MAMPIVATSHSWSHTEIPEPEPPDIPRFPVSLFFHWWAEARGGITHALRYLEETPAPPDHPEAVAQRALYLDILREVDRRMQIHHAPAIRAAWHAERQEIESPKPLRRTRRRTAVSVAVVMGLCASLLGCSYAPQEWLGRQLSGLDCRPQALDARGQCTPTR